MKKVTLMLCMPFMALLIGCAPISDNCETVEPLYVKVGFYEQQAGSVAMPLDTSFLSVYAEGTRAELRNRRLDNLFHLPVPVHGGEVSYVFEQEEGVKVLTLDFGLEARFKHTDCAPGLQIKSLAVLEERTTFENRISVFKNQYFPNETIVAIYIP